MATAQTDAQRTHQHIAVRLSLQLRTSAFWSSPIMPSRILLQRGGSLSMNRFLLISLLASAGAWILIRTSHSPNRVIPVAEAAAKLQQAWADHHTTA